MDAIVAKYDQNGIAQWAKSFGGINDDIAFAIANDHHGRLIVSGIFGENANLGNYPIASSGKF